jgi:hypothetical protein
MGLSRVNVYSFIYSFMATMEIWDRGDQWSVQAAGDPEPQASQEGSSDVYTQAGMIITVTRVPLVGF